VGRLRLLLVLAPAAALLVPSPARAYLCTEAYDAGSQSIRNVTQIWQSRCIPYAISTNGTLLAGDERRQLIAECFKTWTETSTCTDLELLDVGSTDQLDGFDPTAPADQRNAIVALESADLVDHLPDPRLIAITLNHYVTATGEILDSDILVNAIPGTGYRFQEVTVPGDNNPSETACTPAGDHTGPYDLRNTLTHEMGHFIGLDHVLRQDAVMFAQADPCETKKRRLSSDDLAAVCALYPAGQPAHTCVPPSDYMSDKTQDFRNQCDRFSGKKPGGCSCTTTETGGSDARWLVFAIALAWAARGRQRPLLSGR
jgi:MYXO-CTERM domain-containing protein